MVPVMLKVGYVLEYWKFYHQKRRIFILKKSDVFYISAQNIDCGCSFGGSNEYLQFMFLSKIRKIMYTPVNPSFTIQKWGLRGSKLYSHVFVMQRTDNPTPLTLVLSVFLNEFEGHYRRLFHGPLICLLEARLMLWGFMPLLRIMNTGVCTMSLFADYVKFCAKGRRSRSDLDLCYSCSFIYSFSSLQIQI